MRFLLAFAFNIIEIPLFPLVDPKSPFYFPPLAGKNEVQERVSIMEEFSGGVTRAQGWSLVLPVQDLDGVKECGG